MGIPWSEKREKYLIRDKHGRFKEWRGGITYTKTHHGLMTHIGVEFKRQNGRKARVGDVVRKKIKSGAYHKEADWYCRTRYGWREMQTLGYTGKRKPTRKEINVVLKRARPGRGK
jgi:hypothetical protein